MELWVQLNRANADTEWSKKGKQNAGPGLVRWTQEGGNVPLPWMMDVGAFQVRGARPPSVLWLSNRGSGGLETIVFVVCRREDRGVNSMLPNHKRDCIESTTSFLGTSPNRYILKIRSRPVLFPSLFIPSRDRFLPNIRLSRDRASFAMNGGSANKKKCARTPIG